MNKNDNKALNKELEAINNDIKILNDNLIKALKVATIEYIDLYVYIDRLNVLLTRKNKIQYLIAINI